MLHPDSKCPNDAQRRKLCEMLHHAFVEIRWLTANGQSEQASDLADAHNLPGEMWRTFFSFSYFRAAFLEPYYRKWPQVMAVDYRMLLSEAEGLA